MRWHLRGLLSPPIGCLLAFLACGCAEALRAGQGLPTSTETGRAWDALVDGRPEDSQRGLTSALSSRDVREPETLAAFGLASLAFERGDDDTALARYLDVIEAASTRPTARDAALATGAVARLPRLFSELAVRKPAEDRLLALPREQLPWRVQYQIAALVMEIARRRADVALMERERVRAGCLPSLQLEGVAGRLPYLDLAAKETRRLPSPRPLQRSGCRFLASLADSLPAALALRSEIDVAGGTYDLVLDYAGPALLRVDGGPWHRHGDSAAHYGPRWSAVRHRLAAGHHVLELRIGTSHGQPEVGIMAAPLVSEDGGGDAARPTAPLEAAVLNLAGALSASMAGETDDALGRTAALAERPRFSLGLAASARVAESDPTRPTSVNDDHARALYQRALAVDPGMARVWVELAHLDLDNDRAAEAVDNAKHAQQAAPNWWLANLVLADALRARGLERDADAALAAGMAQLKDGQGACVAIESALQRAEDRQSAAEEERLVTLLGRCDAQAEAAIAWHRKRGDLALAETLLRKASPTSADPIWSASELSSLLLARGDARAAAAELARLVETSPHDTDLRIRRADALNAAGATGEARAVMAEATRLFPTKSEVRSAARVMGIPLPLDDFRIDGAEVIRHYLRSGRRYDAPAVVILDRTVERVFPDGARLQLTHTITLVQSKEAIEHSGEIAVPGGAEILGLRTRKADGTIHEAEEIAGKATVSAPNLAVGDFVESETLELKEPSEAFAPGFLADRFYFQSFDAPLDRSEYILVVPAGTAVDLDLRGGAPSPSVEPGHDSTQIFRFSARQVALLHAERSSSQVEDWVPSVRASSGVDVGRWSRYLADRLFTVCRASPDLREVAASLAGHSNDAATQTLEALVDWVGENIEAENNVLEPATVSLARGQGNRAGVLVALARSMGIKADIMFVRSLARANVNAPVAVQELDDFADVLVRMVTPQGLVRFVDPRLRRAPLGYLPPGLDGAPGFLVGDDALAIARGFVKDSRRVSLSAQLQSDGSANVSVTERLAGWPHVEWSEMVDRAGKDQSRLRQEFEQRWLGEQFPGATLSDLAVEPDGMGTRVRYTFKSARMASRDGNTLLLQPSFFMSQPGRRYATEAQRRTPLQVGYDLPTLLEAEIELPMGARVEDVGASGSVAVGAARFSEERMVQSEQPARGSRSSARVLLRRQWQMPIERISPADYVETAQRMRQVDPLEQSEIRLELPAP